jgi:hypothetical protein
MKLIKTANGKIRVKMSKSDWLSIGKTAQWASAGCSCEQDFVSPEDKLKEKGERDRRRKKSLKDQDSDEQKTPRFLLPKRTPKEVDIKDRVREQ